MRTEWTEEKLDAIAGFLKAGLTARQIGAKFGVSRSAIVGVVHRRPKLSAIGFSLGGPDSPQARAAAVRKGYLSPRQRPRKPRADGGFGSDTPPARPPRLERVEGEKPKTTGIPKPDPRNIPMLDLGPNQCKWCVNEPARGENTHLFCAVDTEPGESYCGYHRALSVGDGTVSEQHAISDARRAA